MLSKTNWGLTMRAFSLIVTLLGILATQYAIAVEVRPDGLNCSMENPPLESGEEAMRGNKFLIYPRAKNIGATYSGCQSMWGLRGSKWIVMDLVVIEQGQVVRLWNDLNPKDPAQSCRYKNGMVVSAQPDYCPAPDFLPKKSLAPGCFDKIRQAIAMKQSRPTECKEYE